MKKCFVVCPIGADDSKERAQSDSLLKYILEPVLKEYDFEIIRADKINSPNIITDDILKNLNESELVICDMSSHNPNVFYELGYRHAINKTCITMVHKDESIPFDLSQHRTIKYSKDIDDVEKAKKHLSEMLGTYEDDGYSESNFPANSNQTSNGELLRYLIDIKSEVSDLKDLLKNNPSNDIPNEAITPLMTMMFEDPEKFQKVMNIAQEFNQ
ncbi:putative phage SAP-26 protein [Staphylococcus aureus]|nr:putative phage SAP-26 protein [Staphylococcus aureus]SUL24661.1 putative phage SAP-26 protein [Staphylococcus aureus]